MELVAPGRACHQKRVVEFGEYLCEEILKAVPHRHFILSIPKILRRYFLYDRSLLSDLSRCGWDSLKAFFQEAVSEEGAVPGAVIAIQSFGLRLVDLRLGERLSRVQFPSPRSQHGWLFLWPRHVPACPGATYWVRSWQPDI